MNRPIEGLSALGESSVGDDFSQAGRDVQHVACDPMADVSDFIRCRVNGKAENVGRNFGAEFATVRLARPAR